MSDRYVVVGVHGWGISPTSGPGPGKGSTSYSVLDTANAFREVAQFYVSSRSPWHGDVARREAADRECARLNALDRADLEAA